MSSDTESKKNYVVLLILVLCTIMGGIQQYFVDDPGASDFYYLVFSISTVVLILLWCQLDSQIYGYRIGRVLGITIVVMTFVGVPYYLFKTRGTRAFISLALVIGFSALSVAAEKLGIEIAYQVWCR